jgi:probable phosphoglycerate mutase
VTRIFLVRHGETFWHAEHRYAGSSDVGLTENGFAQADRLARWAADADLAAVYSSPLSRARETAARSAEAAGVALQVEPRFTEVDFAEGEGLTRDEMSSRFPDALERFLAHPATSPLPGGEKGVDAAARFLEALVEVERANAGQRVLIVAHATVIRLVLCRLVGIDLETYRQVFPEMPNTALTEIELDEPQPAALLRFNQQLP